MDFVYRFIYNPFSFRIDSDRVRRAEPVYYGRYEPTKMKKFMIWLMNDRISPVDWEEVPPYVEPEEESAHLQPPRQAVIHPYECYSQPNMLTMKEVYFRRLLLLGFFGFLYSFLERNKKILINFYGFSTIYYRGTISKLVMMGWFYYLACRSFVHIDYQLPYN